MAGRFPFGVGQPGSNPFGGNLDPQADAQMRAALGLTGVSPMEEALYLQMQAEKQREFELQQMLVRERLAQNSRLESLRHEQQLKAIGEHLQDFPDLQQHYSRLLLGEPVNRSVGDRALFSNPLVAQTEEEVRRRQLLASRSTSLSVSPSHSLKPPASPPGNPPLAAHKVPTVNAAMFRDIAADSLAGNAVRRGDVDKRKFAKGDPDVIPTTPKKRPRSNTNDSSDLSKSTTGVVKNRKPKNGAFMYRYQMASQGAKKSPPAPKKSEKKSKSTAPPTATADLSHSGLGSTSQAKKVAAEAKKAHLPMFRRQLPAVVGTQVATASTLSHITTAANRSPMSPRTSVRPSVPATPSTPRGTLRDLIDAADTDDKTDEAATALVDIKAKNEVDWLESESESISYQSAGLPSGGIEIMRLPNFVSALPKLPEEPSLDLPPPPRQKRKGLLDDDSVNDRPVNIASSAKKGKSKKDVEKITQEVFKHLPYPVDPWWPSSADVKKEKKMRGVSNAHEDAEEETIAFGSETRFRANVDKVKAKLSREIQPGVLEKIPHCKIHRMLLQRRKSSAPELVYCWQVTELYPNDLMVCCLQCGTWRHTACGGHYKPFSIREATEKPFVPICDRCHEEEKILEEYPVGKKRLDRQRCEQIRRGLSTSASMRQAAFSKHNGTYKWPLGSVSSSHVGGHTRSVHNRHDKAEKQWTDMAAKLSKGYGSRPKDRVKHRTKELERLLQSVEDAESTTDRHNMLVFLMNDTRGEKPVGYEDEQLNIFDPADDIDECQAVDHKAEAKGESNNEPENLEGKQQRNRETCRRPNCNYKARFDSSFCSNACGVACLENDLLQTFSYSSDMHPSSLRH